MKCACGAMAYRLYFKVKGRPITSPFHYCPECKRVFRTISGTVVPTGMR